VRLQVAKCPRDKVPVPRTQGDKILLATKKTIVAIPIAVVEPAPVLNPAADVPVNVTGVLGIAGTTPVGEDEYHFPSQSNGDVLLMFKQILPVVFAEISVHLFGSVDHNVADYRFLTSLEEMENVINVVVDGHFGRHDVFDKTVTEILDLASVVRTDQSLKHLLTKLFP